MLITGAGASCPFGVNSPLALMADWSKALVQKVVDKSLSVGHRQLLGLDDTMGDGPKFEQHLGRFLRTVEALDAIKPFLKPSLEIFGIPQTIKMLSSGQSELENWYSITKTAISELVDALNQTLYELFGDVAVNYQAAERGYGWLLQELGVSTETPWVCATTNYDVIAETVLDRLGFLPDWGRPHQPTLASDVPLRVGNMIGGIGRYVPVLHLHGRIGWLLRDSVVRELPVNSYSKDWGAPVVMWPDDQKDVDSYAASQVIDSLWQQFGMALSRAKKVLVLGHSLNDVFLLRAIANNVPAGRVAVALLADRPEQIFGPANGPIVERVRGTIGDVSFIPMTFGEERNGVDQLQQWMARAEG